jgi:hypothetical protein
MQRYIRPVGQPNVRLEVTSLFNQQLRLHSHEWRKRQSVSAPAAGQAIPPAELRHDAPLSESSDTVCARVVCAREVQRQRAGRCNAHLDQSQTNAVCRLTPEDQAMLENAIDLLQLSARSMHRILRVARTIADLAGIADILGPHLAETVGYRRGSGWWHPARSECIGRPAAHHRNWRKATLTPLFCPLFSA